MWYFTAEMFQVMIYVQKTALLNFCTSPDQLYEFLEFVYKSFKRT